MCTKTVPPLSEICEHVLIGSFQMWLWSRWFDPMLGVFMWKKKKKKSENVYCALLKKKKIVICVKNLQHKPKRYDVKTEKFIFSWIFYFIQQPRSIYLFSVWMFFLTSAQQTVNYKKKYPSAFKRRFTINQPPPRLRIQKNVLAFYFFSLSFLYFCVFTVHQVKIK